jgi:DNA-binding PadR family transcriptional regulator
MANNSIMLRGFVELLVFRIMEDQGDIYAFELSGLISEYSDGLIRIQHPTLYPTLYRLKERGYISIEKRVVANRERTYYVLQDSGREHYEKIRNDFLTISKGLNHALTHTSKQK